MTKQEQNTKWITPMVEGVPKSSEGVHWEDILACVVGLLILALVAFIMVSFGLEY